jgi:DNA modification methylase
MDFPLARTRTSSRCPIPPYYTACPNPFIEDFIKHYGKPYDPSVPYDKEPFAADVSEGKNDPIYNAHSYHTKVPHKAIMRYIDHYTKPGDLVFDGFCGTGMSGVATAHAVGGRKCLLVDLSPVATFIARNLNGNLDPIAFNDAAKRVVADVLSENRDLYRTIHSGWKVRDRKSVPHKHYMHPGSVLGEVEFVLYSDVVACPNCGAQHPFYSIAVDEIEDALRSEIKCPSCGVVARESDWEACYETRNDPLLNKPHKEAKTVPVLINYSVGTSRFEKLPDEDDLARIALADQTVHLVGFPIVKLIPGKETQRNVTRGITHLHHFFTPRELLCVALLLKRINGIQNASLRHPLLFALTACLPYASRMRRFRADRKGGGPLSGTLYVGSLITPPNVLNSFLRNAETISSSLSYQRSSQRGNFISTQSATALPNFSSNCIDYIFVDPPFGNNFDYSELNFFWEAILGIVTSQTTEAIVSTSQEKALDDYRLLLTNAFKEFFRVLKPGRWMTVEFSNTQAAVWNAIQTALQEAGFVVANVSALDKKQGSFKAVTTTTAVKQDLIISAYKPNGGLEERFAKAGGSEDSAWDFVRTHLKYLPTVKIKDGQIGFVAERDPRISQGQGPLVCARPEQGAGPGEEAREGAAQGVRDLSAFTGRKMKEFRLEVLRAGFKRRGPTRTTRPSSHRPEAARGGAARRREAAALVRPGADPHGGRGLMAETWPAAGSPSATGAGTRAGIALPRVDGRMCGAKPPTACGCRQGRGGARPGAGPGPLDSVQPDVEQILHTTAAAKLLDALEDNLLLAPIQSSVVPLPHQLYALNRAMSRDRIRYLLADEVGLGKTIEAGLILRELKLRGMAKRILVVAPKGLVRQWQAEMRLHFGEKLQFIDPAELAAFRQWRSGGAGDEENLWRMHDQVICSLDSVKPMEGGAAGAWSN